MGPARRPRGPNRSPPQMLAWPVPPDVRLDGDWLTFRYPIRVNRRGKWVLRDRRVRATPGLLSEFIALADSPDERILEYARRFGSFGFCKHGDPRHRLRVEGCGALIVSDGGRNETASCARPYSGGAISRVMHAPCSTLRSSFRKKAQADNPDAAQSGADLRDRATVQRAVA